MQEAGTSRCRARVAPPQGGVADGRRWAWVPLVVGAIVVACTIPGLEAPTVRGDPPSGTSSVIQTVGPGPTPTEAQGDQVRNIGATGPIPTAPPVANTPLPAEAPSPPPPPPPPPAPTPAPGALEAATAIAATAQARATNVAATATALPSQVVVIRGYAFEPATLSIPAGTTVQFRNLDPAAHQIVSGEMDSGRLQANQAWAATFREAATSHTFSSPLYPTMRMTITVTDPLQRPTVVRPSS